ncbi:MAG: glucose-6-phosphate isomerase [Anaerolineae bacterium]
MHLESKIPFIYQITLTPESFAQFDRHIVRRLSSMLGQYHDQIAYTAMRAQEDVIIYEVYEIARPEVAGELMTGLSIVHPGRVGDEYFMTKGHFHAVLETAEIYHCLRGQGYMLMETPQGDWALEELVPGNVLYIPPYWSHRSINTGSEKLVTFFAYPGHAGHDYATIERFGFRKRVIARDGKPTIVDNPRWRPPEER